MEEKKGQVFREGKRLFNSGMVREALEYLEKVVKDQTIDKVA